MASWRFGDVAVLCLEVRDRRVPVLSGLVLFPSPAEGPEGLKLWTGPGLVECARANAAMARSQFSRERVGREATGTIVPLVSFKNLQPSETDRTSHACPRGR